jgi:hypothetical protein
MNDLNRNTRTLIVCFVIAVFALVPLRFVEVGQQQNNYVLQNQVLGEETEEPMIEEEEPFGLEAPYDKLENCVPQEEIEILKNDVYRDYDQGLINEEEVESLLTEIEKAENNICR